MEAILIIMIKIFLISTQYVRLSAQNRNGSPCMYGRCDLGRASDPSVHSSDLYSCILEDICEFFLAKVSGIIYLFINFSF